MQPRLSRQQPHAPCLVWLLFFTSAFMLQRLIGTVSGVVQPVTAFTSPLLIHNHGVSSTRTTENSGHAHLLPFHRPQREQQGSSVVLAASKSKSSSSKSSKVASGPAKTLFEANCDSNGLMTFDTLKGLDFFVGLLVCISLAFFCLPLALFCFILFLCLKKAVRLLLDQFVVWPVMKLRCSRITPRQCRIKITLLVEATLCFICLLVFPESGYKYDLETHHCAICC